MTPSTDQAIRPLAREEWEPLARAHAERADAATAGHRERAPRHEKHPVEDFVYHYYGTRPHVLARWHPGIGVALADAPEHAQWRHYTTGNAITAVDARAFWASRGGTVDYVEALLRATASRPARLGCFGLHEWAMVYRADDDRRHPLSLRLGAAATDRVVAEHKIVCTHVDAFRFFTPEAAPLNATQLTRETQAADEQPGCLHANMDLYKWASKLAPAVSSELIMDTFELAMAIRYVDMKASPYDVRELGLTPIAIETFDGKREYTERQAEFAVTAADLRALLIEACDSIRRAASAARDA